MTFCETNRALAISTWKSCKNLKWFSQERGGKTIHERNAEEKNRYFSEVTRNLQREGLAILPEQDGFLPVELDSQPLCLILGSGAVRYWEKDVASDRRREALEQATDIAKITDEYMSQIESTPVLKAGSLDESYKLLADFNDTVLAGHLTKYGAQFITWSRSPNGTSLNQGNYYGPDSGVGSYTGAVGGGVPLHSRNIGQCVSSYRFPA